MTKKRPKNKQELPSKSRVKKRRVKKVAKKRISRVVKTRNHGTMTEAAFWQFIRAALRNKSRWWKPRLKALEQARRANQSSNKRLKWEFQCCKCLDWHPQTQVEVHHSVPAGSLSCAEDLPGFVERLFAETGWECICKNCHREEHKK